ncbi:helix-turn-helix transcriptional regulator [Catellatospora citrea]|uniref:Helix-turn-helix transcriptional regulator n=1 Tax=Catellatospora citrea TaxID=53366 RepID=A0A8J3KT08_9ACTN|nr:helix-turn-helix transcriptional regulator [Catellatospora citrea]RKE10618.1 regulatory LuxR family protein [Catellatospora citrea]GIG02904.1 helix-turn-helix transcriptional regulator [Catellatospora citrea]
MLDRVVGIPVNSVFVGRVAELAELINAAQVADSGTTQALLIRGEAGVGKTRLVEELLRTLPEERTVAAVGECVEVGDGLPFAPFSAAMRTLYRLLPDEVRAASAGHEDLLARILPELEAGGPVERRHDDTAQVFELITRIVDRLAAHRLVVLVIEDLHWADLATRHLLGYLFRTRHHGRLLLIGTYRSDDVHRRHPLRQFLAEADRLRAVRRIALSRFDRVEVTKQLSGLLGVPPEPAVLNEIFIRSDGNAFFVEELARAYRDQAGLGLDDLRDLLLSRLEALPETSQRIVRIAAEGGAVVGYRLLKAVTGLPEPDLIEGLRAAVLAQILIPDPDGSDYRFRHSLVQEAVSGSLLPGELSLINRQYAEAMQTDTTLVRAEELSGRLARHWYAAHNDVEAFRMSVIAADEARDRYAYAEQLWLLERALQLWDRMPDEVHATLPVLRLPDHYPRCARRQVHAGPDYLDLLATATIAAQLSGDLDRALRLARGALELLHDKKDGYQLLAAWFWTRRSLLVQDLNRGDGRQELQTAHDLVGDLPPSAVLADVLVNIANWGARHRPGPDSRIAAEQAVDYAVRVGAEDLELNARITRCWLDTETDLDGTSLAELYDVRRRAEKLGQVDIIGRVNHNLPSLLEAMGRSQEAIVAAGHSLHVCRSLGLTVTEGWVQANLSASLFSLGRWPDAEAALDEAAAVAQSYKLRAVIAGRRAYSRLVLGDLAQAADQLALARGLLGTDDIQPQLLIPLAHYAVEMATRQDRIAAGRTEFLSAHDAGLTTGPIRYSLPLLCAAAAMEAGAAQAAGGQSPAVLAAIRQAAAQLRAVFPISQAFERLLQAQLRQAEGSDDPESWAAAVAAFEPLDRPYELAVALLGQGRALLGTHRRGAAAGGLARAQRIATRLGAGPIQAHLDELARRAGGSAGAASAGRTALISQTDSSVSSGLTPRELEVLALIARGYRNQRIAEELYISQKTASAHVSNILAKLGAASRTEATAIAHRRGLIVPE